MKHTQGGHTHTHMTHHSTALNTFAPSPPTHPPRRVRDTREIMPEVPQRAISGDLSPAISEPRRAAAAALHTHRRARTHVARLRARREYDGVQCRIVKFFCAPVRRERERDFVCSRACELPSEPLLRRACACRVVRAVERLAAIVLHGGHVQPASSTGRYVRGRTTRTHDKRIHHLSNRLGAVTMCFRSPRPSLDAVMVCLDSKASLCAALGARRAHFFFKEAEARRKPKRQLWVHVSLSRHARAARECAGGAKPS